MKLQYFVKKTLEEIISKYCSNQFSKDETSFEINGKILSFKDEAFPILTKLVDEILQNRPKFDKKYSQEYIRDKLIDIIFSNYPKNSINFGNKLMKDIKILFSELRKPSIEWEFLNPIVNLKFFGIKSLDIGKVSFYALSSRSFNRLNSKFKITKHKKSNEKIRELIKNRIDVLSVVTIFAGEFKKAQDLAFSEVETSLNILRLFETYRQIGLQRDFIKEFYLEEIHYLSSNYQSSGSSIRTPHPMHLHSYIIDKNKLRSMRKNGDFDKFTKLLLEKEKNKLEKKILMSIHWYGLSVRDNKRTDKFVKLIIALESLMAGEERSIKHKISDRIAFLLGKDKTSRKELYRISSRFYSIRSEIVHEGRDNVSEEEVVTLMALVRTLLSRIVRLSTRLESIEEIDNKIKDIKFGSPLKKI